MKYLLSSDNKHTVYYEDLHLHPIVLLHTVNNSDYKWILAAAGFKPTHLD